MTTEQIEALKQEAAQAGDEDMVRQCDLALDGNPLAIRVCKRAVENAKAMED